MRWLSNIFTPKSKEIPGFTLTEDPEKGWAYSVKPEYIDGHRSSCVLPVNPQYDVVRGVELLGYPRVVVHEQMAKSPRTEGIDNPLPGVDKLTDERFYLERILDSSEGPLREYWFKEEFGDEKDQSSGRILSPVEMHPYAKNVFIFPSIVVDYTHGAQFLGSRNGMLTITGAKPVAFVNGKLDLSASPEDTEGLAYVSHVRIPVDFRDYFKSPKDLDDFKGELPVEKAGEARLAYVLFHQLFKEKLEGVGQQVEENRKMRVRGVLLSPIKPNQRMVDAVFRIGYDPEGELVAAASYLV